MLSAPRRCTGFYLFSRIFRVPSWVGMLRRARMWRCGAVACAAPCRPARACSPGAGGQASPRVRRRSLWCSHISWQRAFQSSPSAFGRPACTSGPCASNWWFNGPLRILWFSWEKIRDIETAVKWGLQSSLRVPYSKGSARPGTGPRRLPRGRAPGSALFSSLARANTSRK